MMEMETMPSNNNNSSSSSMSSNSSNMLDQDRNLIHCYQTRACTQQQYQQFLHQQYLQQQQQFQHAQIVQNQQYYTPQQQIQQNNHNQHNNANPMDCDPEVNAMNLNQQNQMFHATQNNQQN